MILELKRCEVCYHIFKLIYFIAVNSIHNLIEQVFFFLTNISLPSFIWLRSSFCYLYNFGR